jgi:hypothetical protein
LDPKCWKNLSSVVSALSWTHVPFDKIHSSAIPQEAGVYLICANTPAVKSTPFSEFLNVLYAGLSTTNIRSRFVKHCTKPDQGVKDGKRCYGFVGSKMTFYFAPAQSKSVAEIERQLIDCFGPPCNRQAGIITARIVKERPAG